ncbi:MAG: EamA family transporter [Actinomycetota bacterium]|nr:EamA family transporter [Actinomycetota bacterium]
MLVGFSGLLVVAAPGGGGSGAWLSILAAVAITAGTLLSRRLAATDVLQSAGWHFVIGGVVLAAVAAAVEGLPNINWTPRFAFALGFLALIGTALAFWACSPKRCDAHSAEWRRGHFWRLCLASSSAGLDS